MRIFVTGQCTLHWGRLEYGNIGNYYVVEPLFKELHRVFPNAEIVTTFQMSDDFIKREKISVLPMELYYSWKDNDLEIAQKEYEIAKEYSTTGILNGTTPYIQEILKCDLFIDFSGDMWGKNADLAGENRFLIGILKDRVAQLLNKKTVMFLGSPGPFSDKNLDLAKETFKKFDLITLREPVSKTLLVDWGFDISKVKNCACQSVLFEAAKQNEIKTIINNTALEAKNNPIIGFTICGWNMEKGPFNRNDYDDIEFNNFVEIIKLCCEELNAKVCLFSHSNGFELPPNFKLINGRDYKLIQQVYDIVQKQNWAKDKVFILDKICLPKEIKAVIQNFDMLISGRVHGAIAGLSSCVPTVIIDYGHEPKAHKLQGFAKLYDIERFIANPKDYNDMRKKSKECFENRTKVRKELEIQVPIIKLLAQKSTNLLKEL